MKEKKLKPYLISVEMKDTHAVKSTFVLAYDLEEALTLFKRTMTYKKLINKILRYVGQPLRVNSKNKHLCTEAYYKAQCNYVDALSRCKWPIFNEELKQALSEVLEITRNSKKGA